MHVVSMVQVCEEAPNVHDPQEVEEACGVECSMAQVRSAQVKSSKLMEGLAAILSANCLIFLNKLILKIVFTLYMCFS
jgi:hypothetical protein